MKRPFCCGKPATPYKKIYNKGLVFVDKDGNKQSAEGWEEGFRCKKCGRIRIPWEPPLDDSKYQAEILEIKKRLIAAGEADVTI
jgi:hypothetical protein